MKSVEFCYWLQGFYEIADPQNGLTAEQTDMIKRHLQLVFVHEIDPSYPKEQQIVLNKIHSDHVGDELEPGPAFVKPIIMRC